MPHPDALVFPQIVAPDGSIITTQTTLDEDGWDIIMRHKSGVMDMTRATFLYADAHPFIVGMAFVVQVHQQLDLYRGPGDELVPAGGDQ